MWHTALVWVAAVVTGVVAVGGAFVYLLASRIYHSIKATPPKVTAGRYDYGACGLMRLIPALKGRIAWVPLGEYPTPISEMTYTDPDSDKTVKVWLKREDMASTKYGGNKVRTLEFQLGCAIEECARKGGGRWAAVGGPGSNQVVASAVFAREHDVDFFGIPAGPERASLDNSLNIVSMKSFPGWYGSIWTWPISKVAPLLIRSLFFSTDTYSMPGGANPTGALGHVGAVLEICEQVKADGVPTPRHIFLPIGSTCTTSGIVAGIAIARKMGLGFAGPVTVHGVPIHHGAARIPMGVRYCIGILARHTIQLIADAGGPDASAELEAVLPLLKLHNSYAGRYGGWTPAGLAAKQTVQLATVAPAAHPKPWMCSCFTSKAAAAMFDVLRTLPAAEAGPSIFWCTKSVVQPTGVPPDDALWEDLTGIEPRAKKWMAHGHLGSKEEYDAVSSRFVHVQKG